MNSQPSNLISRADTEVKLTRGAYLKVRQITELRQNDGFQTLTVTRFNLNGEVDYTTTFDIFNWSPRTGLPKRTYSLEDYGRDKIYNSREKVITALKRKATSDWFKGHSHKIFIFENDSEFVARSV